MHESIYLLYIKKTVYKCFIILLGFIGKYILGCSIEDCVKSGINAGSYIIQQPGMSKGDSFDI